MGKTGAKADLGLGVVLMRMRKPQRKVDLNWEQSRVPFGRGGLRGLFNRVDGHRRLGIGSWVLGLQSRMQTSLWVSSA